MNRFVYLFELDSVRGAPAEMELGQRAMFEEIVKNGNTVVLTFNQLSDSKAFLCGIEDETVYESMLALFSAGALKVSQFGSIRTASQYIQNSIEKCLDATENRFLFSGLPVLSTETGLLETMRDALKYSDLGLLEQLTRQAEDPVQRERLKYVTRFMRMILLLSVEQPAGHPAKTGEIRPFTSWMDEILSILREERDAWFLEQGAPELWALLPEALELLEQADAQIGDVRLRSNRTNWVTQINRFPESDARCLAEAVVDLCYNYTVEGSINAVSRHYVEGGRASFAGELSQRLIRYWGLFRSDIHRFCEGDRDEYMEHQVKFPPWDTAVRVVEAGKRSGRRAGSADRRPASYEAGYLQERRRWNRELLWRMVRRFGTGFLYIVLFCVIDGLVNVGQDGLAGLFDLLREDGLFSAFLQLVCSSILFGLISSNVSNLLHLPDILESVNEIKSGVRDIFRIVRFSGGSAYRRAQNEEDTE